METLLRIGLSNAAAAAVLALGVALLSWPLRGHPALRHRLWLLVLLKLVTPPFWTIPLSWPSAFFAPETPALALVEVDVDAWASEMESSDALPQILTGPADTYEPLSTAGVISSLTPGWGVFLGSLWLVGSCVWLGVSIARIRRFQRVLETTRPAGPDVQEQVAALADQIGLVHLPRVYWIKGLVSPMLWAVLCRPRLILPMGLWARLDPVQRETLLVHELAHLRRRDHWVRALELVVTALYWWFPVVWWARHALRDTEETCCDAWVVWTFPGAARPYAETLVETLDFLSTSESVLPSAASGIGRVSFLKRRLTMIMQRTTPRRLTWSGMLLSLGLSATLLPLAPSWAQVADEPKGEAEVEVVGSGSVDINATFTPLKEEHRLFVFKHSDGEGAERELEINVEGAGDKDVVVQRLKEVLKQIEANKEGSKDDGASKDAAKKALLDAIESIQANKKTKAEAVKTERTSVFTYKRELTDAQKAELDKAQGGLKALAAEVEGKERELKKAAAELEKARAKLMAAKAKFGRGVTVNVPQITNAHIIRPQVAVMAKPGVKPSVDVLFKRGPASPEQEARMTKIEKELKRLSEELAKLREEPAKKEK